MSIRRNWNHFFTLVMLLAVLTGCSTIQPDPPQISLKTLEVRELSLSHALLQAELDMMNPNNFDLNIEHADYRLALNGVEISDGQSSRPITLPANGRGTLVVSLTSSYLDIFSLLQKLRPGEPLRYDLKGTVELGGLGIITVPYPIHKSGEIDLEGLGRR